MVIKADDMKQSFLCILLALTGCVKPDPIEEITEKVFELSKTQMTLMDLTLTEDITPRSTNADGSFRTADKYWWCSGFYPGSLWYTYLYTGDEGIKDLAHKHTIKLDSVMFVRFDHDLGFQMNCSYGNALRITGDKQYEQRMVESARALASRYNSNIGTLRSWSHGKWEFPVIIDNMMNLELLMEGYRLSGDKSLYDIATKHADTTIEHHFRNDCSCWHLVNYNPVDGSVIAKQTVQGYSDDSAWARGQAWALYGYTMMYWKTGLERYLTQAEKIADMLVSRLPEDGIPYWDFDAPDIPDALRDASAGAVMASAFYRLSRLTEDKNKSDIYYKTADTQVKTLATEEYLAKPGENHNFLLKHSVGFLKNNSEVDAPLTYADYYFLEALLIRKGIIE